MMKSWSDLVDDFSMAMAVWRREEVDPSVPDDHGRLKIDFRHAFHAESIECDRQRVASSL